MAQIVIFVPKGEDASAGADALREAGHEVEVVEATPQVLLNMALGMLEEGEAEEEPTEEEPAEEPAEEAEEEPAEEPAEEPTEEAEVKESFPLLGNLMVDDERVPAYLGTTKNELYANGLKRGSKTTYLVNESTFSMWGNQKMVPVQLSSEGAVKIVDVEVKASAGRAFVVLSAATAKALQLA
jgi:hypothetical protein